MNDPLAKEKVLPSTEKLAYKLPEAAEILGISQITVRRLVAMP